MSWLERKEHYQAIAHQIDPSIRLYSKDNWYWRLYAKLPWLGEEFLRQTASVIGPFHFYPDNWSDIEKEIHHEGRHTRQQRWFGLGISPWIGLIPFAIASVLLLPAGLTIRFWLELDAETAALRHKLRTGSNAAYIRASLIEFAETLAGPDYVWSWPRPWAVAIAERKAQKLLASEGSRTINQ